jgi:hypothetical protein
MCHAVRAITHLTVPWLSWATLNRRACVRLRSQTNASQSRSVVHVGPPPRTPCARPPGRSYINSGRRSAPGGGLRGQRAHTLIHRPRRLSTHRYGPLQRLLEARRCFQSEYEQREYANANPHAVRIHPSASLPASVASTALTMHQSATSAEAPRVTARHAKLSARYRSDNHAKTQNPTPTLM